MNYDIPWSTVRLEQRMGRVHRYGQQKEVMIYNLVASNTREGAVLGTLLTKLDRMRDALGSDRVYDVIGEGFRDSTRIAAGDPGMWRDICLDNNEAIVQALDRFMHHLQEIRSAVATEDAQSIEKQLAEGRTIRKQIDKDSGNSPS